MFLNFRSFVSSRMVATETKIPLLIAGDPTRSTFDLKTSVITSFLSVLARLKSLTLTSLSASFMPFGCSQP
jgi:hypothetical protein